MPNKYDPVPFHARINQIKATYKIQKHPNKSKPLAESSQKKRLQINSESKQNEQNEKKASSQLQKKFQSHPKDQKLSYPRNHFMQKSFLTHSKNKATNHSMAEIKKTRVPQSEVKLLKTKNVSISKPAISLTNILTVKKISQTSHKSVQTSDTKESKKFLPSSPRMQTIYQSSYPAHNFPPKVSENKMHSSVDLSILKLIQDNIDSENYLIPSIWPTYSKQRDHCCGLYALATGLKYGNPDRRTPRARKDGLFKEVSLRQCAKEYKFTSFGEIFDVHSLNKLAAAFGFKNCISIANRYQSTSEYINIIINFLKEGGSVIVACDIGNDYLPNNSRRISTHWGLIYGYFFAKGECHFLTYQFGQTYLFSAEKLFLSNQQLPHDNPKRRPFYFHYKNTMVGSNIFQKASAETNRLHPKRYAIGNTLENFAFGLCHVPSAIKINRMNLDHFIATNRKITSFVI